MIFSTQLLILENIPIFFSRTTGVLGETRADEYTSGDSLATGLDEDGVKFDKGLGGRGGGLLPGAMIDEKKWVGYLGWMIIMIYGGSETFLIIHERRFRDTSILLLLFN